MTDNGNDHDDPDDPDEASPTEDGFAAGAPRRRRDGGSDRDQADPRGWRPRRAGGPFDQEATRPYPEGPFDQEAPRPYPEGPFDHEAPRGPVYPTGLPPGAGFGRRAPQRGPRPDADGFYPSDYYVGPDWMRIIAGTLIGAVLIVAGVGGGLYLFDKYNPTEVETVEEEPTPTALPLVPVYQCAGDAQAVTEMMAPLPSLIAGRTADSRWLAFRNPQGTPLQLWVRSTSVPDFDAFSVGIVSCARSSNEFPTPRSAPAPTAPGTPDATSPEG